MLPTPAIPFSVASARGPSRVSGVFVALAAWGACLALGLWVLAAHAGIPGPRGDSPRSWPAVTALASPAGVPRVLVFLHPRCPCSIATLHELERVAPAEPGRLDVTFVVLQPRDSRWDLPAELEPVRAALGASVVEDVGGVEARRFGVECSGHVLAYSPAGARIFDGGVVPGRGHEGENDGREALQAIARGEPQEAVRTAVFGCPLQGADDCLEGPCPTK